MDITQTSAPNNLHPVNRRYNQGQTPAVANNVQPNANQLVAFDQSTLKMAVGIGCIGIGVLDLISYRGTPGIPPYVQEISDLLHVTGTWCFIAMGGVMVYLANKT